jgi:polyhydroxyalkanoate synthesis regulator phasin
MPRKKTPDYGKVISVRAQGDDLAFVLQEIALHKKKPADVLREAIKALRKQRQQTGVAV